MKIVSTVEDRNADVRVVGNTVYFDGTPVATLRGGPQSQLQREHKAAFVRWLACHSNTLHFSETPPNRVDI